MSTVSFRPFEPDQLLLLPPEMRDWLPQDHLVYFILDVVGELDLNEIIQSYQGRKGGQPPFSPRMMVGLLVYGYCVGICSSRRLEQATYEQVPFRVLCADQHPDHDTIAEFRRRHLGALGNLFVQVLQLCQQAGLVKLGHVALDGTKIKANASKHKAMSYERMAPKIEELEAQIKDLMNQAEAADQQEDDRHGKSKRGDELPRELRRKQDRLAKIKEAKAALEQQAIDQAAKEQTQRDEDNNNRIDDGDKPIKHRQPPKNTPKAKAQRNFTDPDSRIMKDGATKAFVQAYNAQAAVDDTCQIIVAADVTQQANDKQQLKPMIDQVCANTGSQPEKLSADNGYFSEANAVFLEESQIDGYLATDRQKHSDAPACAPRGRIPNGASVKDRMARKLRTKAGCGVYKLRKQIVEPVFGQIKACRMIRELLLRGFQPARDQWRLICLTHNLLKLFRHGRVSLA